MFVMKQGLIFFVIYYVHTFMVLLYRKMLEYFVIN